MGGLREGQYTKSRSNRLKNKKRNKATRTNTVCVCVCVCVCWRMVCSSALNKTSIQKGPVWVVRVGHDWEIHLCGEE